MRLADGLEQVESGSEEVLRGVVLRVLVSHHAPALEEPGLLACLFRELGRLLEVATRLADRRERPRAFAGAGEELAGSGLDLSGVGRVGLDLVGGEVVRRHDLDDLLLDLAEFAAEECGRCEMAVLPVPAGERLVGDSSDQVLQKAVLAPLGRARIGLDAEYLLPHERREQRLELGRVLPRERGKGILGEGLSENGSVLEEPAFLQFEPVEPRCDESLQRLRDLELVDRPCETVDRVLLHQQAPVEQHPHRLHGIQGHTLSPAQDPLAELVRQTRDETVEERLHCAGGERLEEQRCLIPRPLPNSGWRSCSSGRA